MQNQRKLTNPLSGANGEVCKKKVCKKEKRALTQPALLEMYEYAVNEDHALLDNGQESRQRSVDDSSSKNKHSFNRDSDWCGPDYIGD